jgi:hypothetical protein
MESADTGVVGVAMATTSPSAFSQPGNTFPRHYAFETTNESVQLTQLSVVRCEQMLLVLSPHLKDAIARESPHTALGDKGE